MPEAKDLKSIYRTIEADNFPPTVRICFDTRSGTQELVYRKVTWDIGGEKRGLRYGENPGQQAAMYRLANGNLVLGDVQTILPGMTLVSDPEMKQSGKHPGKINLTDVDNALSILRYLHGTPTCAIMKHNNPSGVAQRDALVDAYLAADMADRIAAFGGAVVLNRPIDKATAEAIAGHYAEVVVAPEFEEGTLDIFAKKKNLRVMRIGNISRLEQFVGQQYVDFKSLIDGGLILQTAFVPELARNPDAWMPAEASYKGTDCRIAREPTAGELADMRFGWFVEAGVSSNSVIFVKDRTTVAIGTGEQDRVGVAKIAVFKAHEKYRDALCFRGTGFPFAALEEKLKAAGTEAEREALLELKLAFDKETEYAQGGLKGSVAVSDAFFPFRDGVDACIEAGVTAIIQPGGSDRDFESIVACNEADPKVTMTFTGQRSFKH
jgi:phosphoribosylaminoimidazolecarboxamide formyltransferase/IMP cyclohydrolase